MELHPTAYKAAFNLARLYERLGNRAQQVAMLKQSIEGGPRFAEGRVFLAKAYLDGETNFPEAIELAKAGLELKPRADVAQLGHFVLADLYNRVGRRQDAVREVALGRAIKTQ